MPAPTTTEPSGPVAVCQHYVGQLAEVLSATADTLVEGAAITVELAGGTLSEADGAVQLAIVSSDFGLLTDRLFELGEPPVEAAPATALVGESLDLFGVAFGLYASGAETGDGALLDEGAVALGDGSALLDQVPAALPDCAVAGEPVPTELVTPEEFDLTVFFRLAESLLRDSVYAGTSPEELTEAAQAACLVLLDGGDIRSTIQAAVAASPAAGQPFLSDEQRLALFVVTRGTVLWCPSVITDEEAFTSEVISTIVDLFIDS